MDIDGKKIALNFQEKLKEKIKNEKLTPKLAFVLVGEDLPSQSYVKMKSKACLAVGIESLKIDLPETITELELLDQIETLNLDESVHGILVQMPLPKHISEQKIILAINPNKDVDGFHPLNVGKMVSGDPTAIIPCTPLGVLKLLESEKISTTSANIVVLGRSNIVGRPLANLLSLKKPFGNGTVTLAHSMTKDLPKITKNADIVIAAIGKPHFVKAEFIKQNAIVIDVGINYVNGKITGDVDYDNVSKIASYITKVPGGVGPMTIAMLLENTYTLAKKNCLSVKRLYTLE